MNFQEGPETCSWRRKSCTSWCWPFIPVFPGFDTVYTSQVVSRISEPSTAWKTSKAFLKKLDSFYTKKKKWFQSESFKKTTCYLFSIQPFRRHFLVFDKWWKLGSSEIIHFGGPWPPFRLWPVTCIDSSTITSTSQQAIVEPQKKKTGLTFHWNPGWLMTGSLFNWLMT